MHQALGLAAQALFLSSPNPRVGCVLVAPDGRVVGQGFTQQAGGPHAEVMALRKTHRALEESMGRRDAERAAAHRKAESASQRASQRGEPFAIRRRRCGQWSSGFQPQLDYRR